MTNPEILPCVGNRGREEDQTGPFSQSWFRVVRRTNLATVANASRGIVRGGLLSSGRGGPNQNRTQQPKQGERPQQQQQR